LRLQAPALGAAVELHYLSAPLDILYDRIRRRGMESLPIERDRIVHWIEKFQTPTLAEMVLFDHAFELEF
jgi:hypothetical protein